jgi:hypothetical protein
VTLHRRIGDPAAAAMAQWPSTVGVSEPLTGSAGLSIVGAWSQRQEHRDDRRGHDARGRALGKVLADEHAEVSRDAGCCLAQQGRRAEVTAAADAGDGQRNPGLDRAATRPRRTPRRRGELG